jgi:hypothetical protein
MQGEEEGRGLCRVIPGPNCDKIVDMLGRRKRGEDELDRKLKECYSRAQTLQ